MPLSQKLSLFTSELDKIFNHVLGYVIAFSALIAFADVLGDGKITQYIPWLFWIWVIAQGLGIEFQVFILIRRLPRLWQTNRWMFWTNIAFISGLCVMSILIGSVFVEHDNAGGTIEHAMGVLGIDHIFFIYVRSALAILLVALIAIDRAMEQHEQVVQPTVHPDVITLFEQRLVQLAQAEQAARDAMVAVMRTEMSNVVVSVEQTVEQHTQKLLAMPKEAVLPSTPMEGEHPVRRLRVVQGRTVDSNETVIRTIMRAKSGISVRELAKQASVSPSTANKWRERILAEQGEQACNE